MRATEIITFRASRRRRVIERLATGLTAGVWGQVKIVWRIAPPAAETGVGEIPGGGGLRVLAAGAAPVTGGGWGGIGGGSRGASPFPDAVEVEDGEAG